MFFSAHAAQESGEPLLFLFELIMRKMSEDGSWSSDDSWEFGLPEQQARALRDFLSFMLERKAASGRLGVY